MWIRDKEIKSPIIIAPMAGISNDAFIQLCFEFEAGLAYGEMVSDKAIYYGNEKTRKMLEFSEDNHPLSLQLFGSDISTMVYAARYLDTQSNCDFIDINMGCPVNKVVETGAGSAMMKNEDETVRIVEKIVNSVSKPVTVKMRLGWDNQHINYLSLSKKLEKDNEVILNITHWPNDNGDIKIDGITHAVEDLTKQVGKIEAKVDDL